MSISLKSYSVGVARGSHVGASRWLRPRPDLHVYLGRLLTEKRRVGGSIPPLPTSLGQRFPRSEPLSLSVPRSRRLAVRDPQRPRFAAPYRTWIARRSFSVSARSGPLSWHVQPNRVPPSTPRVARDECLLAPRCTRRRREHAHASAGQLPVSADPHLHQVAAHLHVNPQVDADGIADPGGTPRSTAQAFLCRRVVTSLGACRVDPGPSPTVPGWRLANRPTAERGYGCALLTAGPRRWRCTAEERSVVHGSKPVI